jgi:hypothetical protein
MPLNAVWTSKQPVLLRIFHSLNCAMYLRENWNKNVCNFTQVFHKGETVPVLKLMKHYTMTYGGSG